MLLRFCVQVLGGGVTIVPKGHEVMEISVLCFKLRRKHLMNMTQQSRDSAFNDYFFQGKIT